MDVYLAEYLLQAAHWSMGDSDIDLAIVQPVEDVVRLLSVSHGLSDDIIAFREKLGNAVIYRALGIDDELAIRDHMTILRTAVAALLQNDEPRTKPTKINWRKEGF